MKYYFENRIGLGHFWCLTVDMSLILLVSQSRESGYDKPDYACSGNYSVPIGVIS